MYKCPCPSIQQLIPDSNRPHHKIISDELLMVKVVVIDFDRIVTCCYSGGLVNNISGLWCHGEHSEVKEPIEGEEIP